MSRSIKCMDLIKSEISDFNWVKVKWITELHLYKILNKYFEEVPVLEMQLEYLKVGKSYLIKLLFKSIQNLKLSSTTEYGIHLSSFEITDISDDGWCDLNYKVNDYETENIMFYCKEIEIISITKQ